MLDIGDQIPDLSLEDATGQRRGLRQLCAEAPRLLYFYPGDFTPVCTKQACFYRDEGAALAEHGVSVVGIGPKGADSKARFQAAHELPFLLLADPDGDAARAFGVRGPLGLYVARVSFLVDREGVVRGRAKGNLRLGPHKELAARAGELLNKT